MYNANNNVAAYQRKLGTKTTKFEKQLCGCFCLSVMLFFLVGPFLFFSNLRYIANYNSITDSRIALTLAITESNEG